MSVGDWIYPPSYVVVAFRRVIAGLEVFISPWFHCLLRFIEKCVIPLPLIISSIVAVYKSEFFCSGQ
jgi:hypothetical protein